MKMSNHIYMKERELKYMSQSELIALIMKLNKKSKPVKPKTKQINAKNNLESLFYDDNQATYEKTNKINKLMKKVHKMDNEIKKIDNEIQNKYNAFPKTDVIIYPKIDVSLNKFRKYEARLTKTMRIKNSSFQKLFEKRLHSIKGIWERISITLHVDIWNGLLVTEKTYGPFTIDVPRLNNDDMYKFMVYALLKNNFTLLSAEEIKKIGCKIITHNKKFFMKHNMGSLKLESYLLNKQRPIKSHGKNTCVVDYVWHSVQGKKGFKTYSYDKLKNEIYEFVYEAPMINTEELIDWAKQCHTNVSIHAYDSTYRKFTTHTNHHPDITLVYIVKDHHCFPITDEKLKLVAAKANQGGCDNLLKHMSDLKWSRRHENIYRVEKLNDLYDIDKENNIIILPEEVKMTQAIDTYILKSNLYVEYLHWNNNSVLDGFIDHKQNMYLLNDEYDVRKSICDKLFDIYKTHDFKWTNQSYTSISTNLYKQMSGYLPESSYNVNTRQMLDDFYPRALQWCTTDDIPDNVVNIDICKSYPSILLNNKNPIPIYSIHDTVEQFFCKNDLRQCGEFYIDETILNNYGTPLKIEAGFYSSNLISYLVDNLNMSLSKIKYKIVSKRALKPDTFRSYIKYIFDNFSESEAKKLANSFIGELGRKYNKINHGFTCTDYDTAMCCWTRAMADKRNVTIDHYNNIFLIKEQTCERIFSDNTSINRFVVSEAILKCLQLIETCHGENSELYGYNTDGIYITNPNTTFKNKKDVKFNTRKIGKAYVTDTELNYFEKHYRDSINIDDYKVKPGKGCIFNGQAGSGKTTLLCEMVQQANSPLVLSFTNKAIENVKKRLNIDDENKICHTFDSYFCEWNGRNIDSLKDKTIFIEEFSMVPNKWMTKIYEAYNKFNNTIYMFGDPNQCEPVEPGSQIHYNYLLSKSIQEMCPKTKTLEYIEKSCRYDKTTHVMLSKFLKTGRISTYFEPIGKYYKNICYLNSTRAKVTYECCDRFIKENDKNYTVVDFKYNSKKETYNICEGMPVLATQNIKDKKIFNTMEFVIEEIKNDKFKVNNEWFEESEFAQNFIPAFCVTVYKYQGCDINEHYNIHDVNLMDKKQLYTSLSRTPNSNIFIVITRN